MINVGRIFKITGSYKDRRKVEFSGKIVVEKDNGFMGACVEKETAQKVHIVGAFATNQRRGHKGEKGISFYYSTDNTGFPSYSFITPDLKNPAHSAIRVYELNQGWTDIGRYSIKVALYASSTVPPFSGKHSEEMFFMIKKLWQKKLMNVRNT